MNNIANQNSWKNYKITENKRILKYNRFFTLEEFNKIKNGFIPESMDDHWFVYYENKKLFFHRSWTGYCIFEVEIKKDNDLYKVTSIVFDNKFNAEYYDNDDYILNIFNFLIDHFLLKKEVEIFYPRAIRKIFIKENFSSDDNEINNISEEIIDKLLIKNDIMAAFLGHAVGDALGVPVEFLTRKTLIKNPILDITGYGTHNQPEGTWSDDSSLTFCLAESLISGYDINDISKNFVKWLYEGFWTANGRVFDVGLTTKESIKKIKSGVSPNKTGSYDKYSNGNGSLMRMLPLIFYLYKYDDINLQIKIIHEVGSITHAHMLSNIACSFYVFFGISLLKEDSIQKAYQKTVKIILEYYSQKDYKENLLNFNRLFSDISTLDINQIKSSGYVIDSLEASIWCLLKTNSFREAVLTAVNLGEDTDTIGAITGGLAGIFYGIENIPYDWYSKLVRLDDIIDLSERFSTVL